MNIVIIKRSGESRIEDFNLIENGENVKLPDLDDFLIYFLLKLKTSNRHLFDGLTSNQRQRIYYFKKNFKLVMYK